MNSPPVSVGSLRANRTPPQRGGAGRRLADALLGAAVLLVESLVVLSAWGPQPVGWLWVGSQADYRTGSVFLGIKMAFLGLVGSLILTLMLATRLDALWRVLRRAAGDDQRQGVLGRIFAVTAGAGGMARLAAAARADRGRGRPGGARGARTGRDPRPRRAQHGCGGRSGAGRRDVGRLPRSPPVWRRAGLRRARPAVGRRAPRARGAARPGGGHRLPGALLAR